MLILSSGCSFIWGSEMPDCRHHGLGGFSRSTWPALLAKSVTAQYDCVATAGAGNDIIARNVIAYCENTAVPGLVIVQWTFPWRFGFRFVYPTTQWRTIDLWTIDDEYKPVEAVLTPSDEFFQNSERIKAAAKSAGVKDFANTFFKHISFGEYWPVYSTLKEIIGLQNYLTIKNIPFIFTCADNVIFDCQTAVDSDDFIKMYQNQLNKEHWFMFPSKTSRTSPDKKQPLKGFYQWVGENKYDTAPGGHPLEQAHKDAAMLIQGKFNEMVKTHLE